MRRRAGARRGGVAQGSSVTGAQLLVRSIGPSVCEEMNPFLRTFTFNFTHYLFRKISYDHCHVSGTISLLRAEAVSG